MAARRQAWFDGQPDLDPERLIFIDESGASTKMARLRGRARRGERCRAAVPHGHWKTTTFVGALRLRGMTAPMVLDGPMNGPAFLAYVEQVLAPTLAAGETVIMDNQPAPGRHRRRLPQGQRHLAARRRAKAAHRRVHPVRGGLPLDRSEGRRAALGVERAPARRVTGT